MYTVNSLGHYVFVRHRHNWNLLFRFGLVGGSGVLVNLLVLSSSSGRARTSRRSSSTSR